MLPRKGGQRVKRRRMSRTRRRGLIRLVALLGAGAAILIWVFAGGGLGGGGDPNESSSGAPAGKASGPETGPYHVPPLLNPSDVYAADRPGDLSPVARKFPSRVYVPNSDSNTVSVIDPGTHRVIDQFPVGEYPQHVVPSYDLKTL